MIVAHRCDLGPYNDPAWSFHVGNRLQATTASCTIARKLWGDAHVYVFFLLVREMLALLFICEKNGRLLLQVA
eukprot:1158836-Pelagomonas_calceolata.AAC.7